VSIYLRRRSIQLAILAVVLASAGAAWVVAAGPAPGREITLVARDMAFYRPGDPTPNPTLRLAAGETVRLTLVNLDRGMRHDLVVDGLGFAVPLLAGDGGSAGAVLRAPRVAGEHDYLCSLHPRLMRGRVVVEPAAVAAP
jgi:plastocyanin